MAGHRGQGLTKLVKIKNYEAQIKIEARTKLRTNLHLYIDFEYRANSWIIDVGARSTLSITILV
ncbi:hypothetical protein EPI10_006066 [Gossypium australe]|uniref:Uncharacterized protein n=1 Tax=Gossypium australe TaxID=47621 RepID=A0A5B6WSV2_9ROSI|nr:hypothetical protein EPI10_006066 [Gossypium australe]